MRGLLKYIFVFLLFFIGTLAILEIDDECKSMTGSGGEIGTSVQLIVEKMGNLG